jgi:hypothetical protein
MKGKLAPRSPAQVEALGEPAKFPASFLCYSHGRRWPKSRSRRPPASGSCWSWWPPAGLVVDGRLPLSLSLGIISSRPFVDQRTRLEDTPSRGKFVKEPLCFFELEPAVLWRILKICFVL